MAVVILSVLISMMFLLESTGFEKSTIRRYESRLESSVKLPGVFCILGVNYQIWRYPWYYAAPPQQSIFCCHIRKLNVAYGYINMEPERWSESWTNHTHKQNKSAHIFHPVNGRRSFVIHPQFSRESLVRKDFLLRRRRGRSSRSSRQRKWKINWLMVAWGRHSINMNNILHRY